MIKGYDSIKALATKVWFTRDMFYVQLHDGRKVVAPLLWFPGLRRAIDEQLSSLRLIGNGTGIRRDDIDEDISVAALL